MINAGIIGATGYAGSELTRLLYSHQEINIYAITSQSYAGQYYGDVFENFKHTPLNCRDEDLEDLAVNCDVVFTALPHGIVSKKINESILSKTKVIDLGADFRLKDINIYNQWYGEHLSPEFLPEAVYGLCEINRDAVRQARLIANPGCYTTCSILSLYPLLKEKLIDTGSIIIDAKSGVSGAGRGVNLGVHFCETDENIKAYKIASHRHAPEIEEQLSYAAGEQIALTFTPHLIPMNRGILSTCYAKLKGSASYEDIKAAYEKYYGDEYFIRLTKKGGFPETKWVKASNFMDIGFTIDSRTSRIIVVGALDNLVKGAAGQAIQNMNILFGLPERMGLEYIPAFPL